MSATDAVHLYALISLRALADYDPYEFRRSTDLTRREVDDRIQAALEGARYHGDERLLTDAGQRLDDLRALEATGESPAALSYLLRQVSNSALERAYQLALRQAQSGETRRAAFTRSGGPKPSIQPKAPAGTELEFLRLAVMRLLRDLPNYEARFDYLSRNLEIDCLLQSRAEGEPPVLIEAKAHLKTGTAVQAALATLKKLTAGWGRGVIGVILTMSISEEARTVMYRFRGKYFVLTFDPESNEFLEGEREAFLSGLTARVSA